MKFGDLQSIQYQLIIIHFVGFSKYFAYHFMFTFHQKFNHDVSQFINQNYVIVFRRYVGVATGHTDLSKRANEWKRFAKSGVAQLHKWHRAPYEGQRRATHTVGDGEDKFRHLRKI
jgi:hypothetical protein